MTATPTLYVRPDPDLAHPRALAPLVYQAAFEAVKAAFEHQGRAPLDAPPEGMTFLEPAPRIADRYR